MKPTVSKRIASIIVMLMVGLTIQAQPENSLEQLLPKADINTSIDKIYKQAMGIGAYVNVSVIASLNDYNACSNKSISHKGLNISATWYNTNDETGRFMLSTLQNLDGITQDMNAYKTQSGFDIDQAKEETIDGGKLWIITRQKPCVNTISGPTGVTEHFTQIRCFVFKGSTVLKIDIKGNSKPEKMREIIKYVIEASAKFDYAALKDVVTGG